MNRRRLFLALSLGLVLGSCAIGPQVKVAVEVFDSEEAKNRSVAVIADLYMKNPVEADRLAQLIRNELTAHGFKVQEKENEAELVVIPTIEHSQPTIIGATRPPPRGLRPFDLSYGLGSAKTLETQNALRNLGFELGSVPAAPEERKAGLMVTAITRETWFKALLNKKKEIPRVWRITAVSPLTKEDVTPKLVEAVGSKLNEVVGGRLVDRTVKAKTPKTKKPHPTPGASPQKKSASN